MMRIYVLRSESFRICRLDSQCYRTGQRLESYINFAAAGQSFFLTDYFRAHLRSLLRDAQVFSTSNPTALESLLDETREVVVAHLARISYSAQLLLTLFDTLVSVLDAGQPNIGRNLARQFLARLQTFCELLSPYLAFLQAELDTAQAALPPDVQFSPPSSEDEWEPDEYVATLPLSPPSSDLEDW
ncbi:uncharacterized protein LOC132199113 [Neocloeon triangulifer]|uniref:uncharacterized protein LOC132194894 n=1 Tax=Neocloeon triangulifer TaxID=2078957 RepID=UPI00286F5DBF|nr:uncharacterized protein LOC132194894 [Neocloeon triangulifer]XP_059479074.1 uncharacterized protein LOC132198837 [Neocloeon triangulifer]XP_059479587.1 uncharacterized protein LOC132199113 [Neocloeon triangulifer]